MSHCEPCPSGRHLLLALLAGVLLSVAQQFVADVLSVDDAEMYYDAVSATLLQYLFCIDFYSSKIKMIMSKGYSAEIHNATTRDGYVLTLHRISHGQNNKSEDHHQKIL